MNFYDPAGLIIAVPVPFPPLPEVVNVTTVYRGTDALGERSAPLPELADADRWQAGGLSAGSPREVMLFRRAAVYDVIYGTPDEVFGSGNPRLRGGTGERLEPGCRERELPGDVSDAP